VAVCIHAASDGLPLVELLFANDCRPPAAACSVGEKRILRIPPSLGYGSAGAGGIIPGELLCTSSAAITSHICAAPSNLCAPISIITVFQVHYSVEHQLRQETTCNSQGSDSDPPRSQLLPTCDKFAQGALLLSAGWSGWQLLFNHRWSHPYL